MRSLFKRAKIILRFAHLFVILHKILALDKLKASFLCPRLTEFLQIKTETKQHIYDDSQRN